MVLFQNRSRKVTEGEQTNPGSTRCWYMRLVVVTARMGEDN